MSEPKYFIVENLGNKKQEFDSSKDLNLLKREFKRAKTDLDYEYMYFPIQSYESKDGKKTSLVFQKCKKLDTIPRNIEAIDEETSKQVSVVPIIEYYRSRMDNFGKSIICIAYYDGNNRLKTKPLMLKEDLKYMDYLSIPELLVELFSKNYNSHVIRTFYRSSIFENAIRTNPKFKKALIDLEEYFAKVISGVSDIVSLKYFLADFVKIWCLESDKKTLNYLHTRDMALLVKEIDKKYNVREIKEEKSEQMKFI